jgi:hypothetical protein
MEILEGGPEHPDPLAQRLACDEDGGRLRSAPVEHVVDEPLDDLGR